MTSETPLEISVQQLNEMLNAGESLTILDVREPQELAICKLGNSLDIPMQSIPARFAMHGIQLWSEAFAMTGSSLTQLHLR